MKGARLLSVAGNATIALSSMYTALLFALTGKAESYGYFAFFLLVQALSCGFVNSLVNTPHFDASKSKVASYRKLCDSSFFVATILLSFLSAISVSFCMFSLGASLPEFILSGASVFCYCIRWHLRSVFNTANKNYLCYRSDFLFSISYMLILTLVCLLGEVNIFNVMFISFLSSLISLVYSVFCYSDFVSFNNFSCNLRIIRLYFYKVGSVTLIGVVSTEILSNFFSYLVTYKFGVASFSIVALSIMLFRPVMVVSTSISQSERAQLRSTIHDREAYRDLIKKISKLVLVAYTLNTFFAFVIIYAAELFKMFGEFHYEELYLYTCFFSVIFFARSVTSILSLDFQARGLFILISKITMFMAILAVLLLSVFSYFEDIVVVLYVFAFVEIITSIAFYRARMRVLR